MEQREGISRQCAENSKVLLKNVAHLHQNGTRVSVTVLLMKPQTDLREWNEHPRHSSFQSVGGADRNEGTKIEHSQTQQTDLWPSIQTQFYSILRC